MFYPEEGPQPRHVYPITSGEKSKVNPCEIALLHKELEPDEFDALIEESPNWEELILEKVSLGL